MKLNKVLFIATALIGGLLTSCNDEGYWNGASNEDLGLANGSTYTFNSATASYTFEPQETVAGKDVQITVTRGTTQGTATVPVQVQLSDPTTITAAESVTFADGSATATLPLHFAKELTPGVKVTAVLTIDPSQLGIVAPDSTLLHNKTAEDSATYENAYATYQNRLANYKLSTTVTFYKDLRWEKIGSCTFVDYTFSEDGAAAENVPIENALGTNRYRIVKPFMAIYGEDAKSDTGIAFILNEDNSFELEYDSKGTVATVQLVEDGEVVRYDFMWVAKYVPTYCKTSSEGNIYQASMLGLVDGEGYYTGFQFAFQWTEGWPFAK